MPRVTLIHVCIHQFSIYVNQTINQWLRDGFVLYREGAWGLVARSGNKVCMCMSCTYAKTFILRE